MHRPPTAWQGRRVPASLAWSLGCLARVEVRRGTHVQSLTTVHANEMVHIEDTGVTLPKYNG